MISGTLIIFSVSYVKFLAMKLMKRIDVSNCDFFPSKISLSSCVVMKNCNLSHIWNSVISLIQFNNIFYVRDLELVCARGWGNNGE